MSREFHELRVAAIVEETQDSRSFVLEIPSALQAQFAYQAGQFLTFEIPWNGFFVRRCYSLASSPDIDSEHKVTVKRFEGGRVSNWMIDRLRVGDTLRVKAPDGRFVLTERPANVPLTLFAGGSGITPLVSLMKSALAKTGRSVKLIYANRSRDTIIFSRALDALLETYPGRLEIHHHIDSEGGYLSIDAIRALIVGREEGDHYVCGPSAFMDTVERALELSGVPPHRLRIERFVSPIDPDQRAMRTNVEAVDRDHVPQSFAIRVNGKVHMVPYEPGLTLLVAAQKAGLKPPSSCEDGFCGSCMAQLVGGDVVMKTREALTDKQIAEGRILLCQSLPKSTSPIEVDCDAASFGIQSSQGAGARRQAVSRAFAALLVVLVIAMLLFLRSRV